MKGGLHFMFTQRSGVDGLAVARQRVLSPKKSWNVVFVTSPSFLSPPATAPQFFGRFGLSGTYVNSNNITCSATTARDLKHGDEYFGTFSASLLTNFQVLTGESWSEIIARPILAVGIVEKVSTAGMGIVGRVKAE